MPKRKRMKEWQFDDQNIVTMKYCENGNCRQKIEGGKDEGAAITVVTSLSNTLPCRIRNTGNIIIEVLAMFLI